MLNHDRPILVISDLQIPYEHKHALDFCSHLKKIHKIPNENVLCVGDEVDQLHGSNYPKDPNVPMSPTCELAVARRRIKEWAQVFPKMKIAVSNHGLRWVKKATLAEIPEELMRRYQDVMEMPTGWEFKDEWRFDELKHPFRMIHGMGYSGKDGHRNAAIDSNISTVIGHLHSFAAVDYIEMNGSKLIWAANTGCLIDIKAHAFKYEKYNRSKPILGATVIFFGGKMPIFYPL